ncbi:MAG: halocyanin domain-containing protein [Halobacteria archaeon]|nr:halocyanin domain-containing protein [Halobacteria archaeon]
MNRRDFIKATGLVAVAGLTGVAGCIAGAEESDPYADRFMLDNEPDYQGWFNGVGNYNGTLDLRGGQEVNVRVGVKGGLGFYKFGPPAIAVSPGTTVRWEWMGKGGSHDVVAEKKGFKSKLTAEKGFVFKHTFDSPGIYKYYCTPHKGMGMKGAVYVLE